jgi:hypothetical protein
VIIEWAVEHFERVHAQLDLWCSLGNESALPPVPRQVGIAGLRALDDSLREAMLRRRYGL